MKNTFGLTLRAPEPDDVDTLYGWENLPDVERVSIADAPVSHYALWQYVEAYTGNIFTDRQLRLMIEVDGTAVGTVDIADFSPRNRRAWLGIMVAPPYRGKGYAKEALQKTIAYCRELGMHQLAVMVAQDNEASLALFKNTGFTTSGRLRSWMLRGKKYEDVIVLQLMLDNAPEAE